MKKSLLGIMIVLSSVASIAGAKSSRPLKVATLNGNYAGITEVALLSDGTLSITSETGTVSNLSISEVAAERLLNHAETLSNVEVKTENRTRVCAMMPRPDLNFLAVSTRRSGDHFTGNLVTTLTPRDCSRGSVTYPVESYDLMGAEIFRAELAILALANQR